MGKVLWHTMMSLDGFIAGPNDDMQWAFGIEGGAASKGAVLAMTKSMQVDLAPDGIRVNALLPGTILTPFVERYLKSPIRTPKRGWRQSKGVS